MVQVKQLLRLLLKMMTSHLSSQVLDNKMDPGFQIPVCTTITLFPYKPSVDLIALIIWYITKSFWNYKNWRWFLQHWLVYSMLYNLVLYMMSVYWKIIVAQLLLHPFPQAVFFYFCFLPVIEVSIFGNF